MAASCAAGRREGQGVGKGAQAGRVQLQWLWRCLVLVQLHEPPRRVAARRPVQLMASCMPASPAPLAGLPHHPRATPAGPQSSSTPGQDRLLLPCARLENICSVLSLLSTLWPVHAMQAPSPAASRRPRRSRWSRSSAGSPRCPRCGSELCLESVAGPDCPVGATLIFVRVWGPSSAGSPRCPRCGSELCLESVAGSQRAASAPPPALCSHYRPMVAMARRRS